MSLKSKLQRIKKFFYDYDFIDSIIENLYFDNSLVNFCLLLDYYFTEETEEHIKLTFENCTEVSFEIPQELYEMNNNVLNFSHFTITKITTVELDSQVCIRIFTVNNETEFLKILCGNVSFESVKVPKP
ncbi:hypothetical protein [Enterococcus pallens]|uniref:Uncharacterized protein n=1 Tax=Enterococcus pallens ATCC BAA-351 TaxID=1158607 RepID=R2T524_9ENTE|nr:hypothetical protein [Enterococcus pallens]EOH95344.1 hypothetical protein UAU_01306 [Enterococcus pallens ATCC BAA-351]EOU21519.1 hypothetical protein I588_02366 [Enterococcus pallens ATCC BAA-351]OJG79674.1 hypothetical protein RV10_GL000462 [Enterococcus pallens]